MLNDEELEVSVTDTGIGIKERDLTKLFKFFGKLQSSKNINKGGMGLGLTISKMILQAMQGNIIVESRHKKGSKFTFKFKVERVQV